MKQVALLITVVSTSIFAAFGQYAPAAGQPGSTAIHADSSVFQAWATTCTVDRGPMDITAPENGTTDYGIDIDGNGAPDNLVISLGDGGTAILEFTNPIKNGSGPDFAVFENSMWYNFLELCFVEVSSNGTDYYRFPAVSLTQTDTQVATFGYLEASHLYNFGGKYEMMYGTPFDLNEMTNITGLDVDHITHVKLIDVVGSVDANYASYDSQGNAVNDPWPTAFGSSGFDLDAVGVIHEAGVGIEESNKLHANIYPQPAKHTMWIELEYEPSRFANYQLLTSKGTVLQSGKLNSSKTHINTAALKSGLYLLKIITNHSVITQQIVIAN